MRTLLALFFSFILVHASELTVAAAANVSYAMRALTRAFEAEHPGTKVRVIVGSSGKLTAQIRRGAPYDLFLSADMGYPEALAAAGVTTAPPRPYALGALVLLSPHPRDLSGGLKVLEDPSLHRIAVANPRTAPYGRAAREALEHAGLYEKLRPRFVYGESIAQTVAYTLTAADIGLVAKSALFAPRLRGMKAGSQWVDVNASLYTPIRQGAVLLKRAADRADAKAFYDFLYGEKARKIFRDYGYLLP
jgi:molybdate transport system substrate-binding protein